MPETESSSLSLLHNAFGRSNIDLACVIARARVVVRHKTYMNGARWAPLLRIQPAASRQRRTSS